MPATPEHVAYDLIEAPRGNFKVRLGSSVLVPKSGHRGQYPMGGRCIGIWCGEEPTENRSLLTLPRRTFRVKIRSALAFGEQRTTTRYVVGAIKRTFARAPCPLSGAALAQCPRECAAYLRAIPRRLGPPGMSKGAREFGC